MKQLSAKFVREVTDPGRYYDGDAGLFLLVQERAGRIRKAYVQRLTVHGKRRDIGLGSTKWTTLTEARAAAQANRKAARQGGDPLAEKRTMPTFADAFESALAIQAAGWRGSAEKTARSWRNMVGEYAMPRLGGLPVDRITTADVLAVLAPIWGPKRETARKLRQRVGAVMKWAVAEGHRADDPTGAALTAVLPKNGKVVAHHRALPFDQVAGALDTVRQSSAWWATKGAFEFLVLTACRSGELRRARWVEVDFDTATWTVPAARTKTGIAHRVPLAPRAMEILREAQELSEGEIVFPSVTGRPLSDNTLSKLLRDHRIAMVPHGARSSFRDFCGAMAVDREVAEAALAHSRPGVEAAYHRADLFERRRAVMERWSAYLSGESAKVVKLREAS